MFKPRPSGITLVRDALARPHDPQERIDPEFPVAMRCSKCGKLGYGPRKFMSEAIREHQENECPARKTRENDPQVTQILFPRI